MTCIFDCDRDDESLPGEGHRCWDPYYTAAEATA